MDEKLKETISALMDDEANDIETQRALSRSKPDELVSVWRRYHLARDLMSGMSHEVSDIDVSGAVAAAIRGEKAEPVTASAPQKHTPEQIKTASHSGWLKYGGAIAACLVVAVGIVNQQGSETYESVDAEQLVVNELDASQAQQFNKYLLRHSELSTVTVASGMAPLIRVASVNSIGI